MLNVIHRIMLSLLGYRLIGKNQALVEIRTPYSLHGGQRFAVSVRRPAGEAPIVSDLGIALVNLVQRERRIGQDFVEGAEEFGLNFNEGVLETTIRPGLMLAADIDRFARAVVAIQAVAAMQSEGDK